MEPLYFVHISDTHIGPTAVFRDRHNISPYPCAEKLVDIINNLETRPDFVIHTGDVVYDPDPAAFAVAAELFSRLNVPIYYVNGNHDGKGMLASYLPMGSKTDLSNDPDTLSYAFEVKGERFVVVDARGPDEIDPQGLFSEAQLEVVRSEAQPDGPPLTIFMHYPALPMNSGGMDREMLVQNGRSFHNLLLPAKERLRGVFHGHVHQNMQVMHDGIFYASIVSAYSQFVAWPHDETVQHDFEHEPGYGFVHLLDGQMIVHQHTFPRPD
ncbi:MAG: metallophosphoesterase [Anaerolineae bacterium]|nr:metallophosphoesterase [Anaerolineae bacterium]